MISVSKTAFTLSRIFLFISCACCYQNDRCNCNLAVSLLLTSISKMFKPSYLILIVYNYFSCLIFQDQLVSCQQTLWNLEVTFTKSVCVCDTYFSTSVFNIYFIFTAFKAENFPEQENCSKWFLEGYNLTKVNDYDGTVNVTFLLSPEIGAIKYKVDLKILDRPKDPGVLLPNHSYREIKVQPRDVCNKVSLK